MNLRPPAVPLITVDPYFSVWSSSEQLNAVPTMHWTGATQMIIGTVAVDGNVYSFLGFHRNLHKMKQISLEIDAFSTTAVFQNDAITLTAVFTTPLLPDSYELLTRPVSYLSVSYAARDGKKHNVRVSVSVSEEICLDRVHESPVVTETVAPAAGVCGIKMGNSVQNPLNRSGDNLRIDWGYFYLCAKSDKAETDVSTDRKHGTTVDVSAPLSESSPLLYMFAYDDVKCLEYFGKHICSYWNRNGKTALQAIAEAANEYDVLAQRCHVFSEKLHKDAEKAGGRKYAELLDVAYRQVIAAHKLAVDENGEIIFVSKECFSNGCAATVDVSYPSIPMFLLYNPELIKGMLRPIYRYAVSDAWSFDFAPHDVGQYPLLNGQVYGKNALCYQMPVEECGNMLIMEANVALATGSADFAAEHMDLLTTWCNYLLRFGADPENQLCTDDFAGHLAHNCNLSLKAIMGICGMSILQKMSGNQEKATYYREEAEKMAATWMKTARNADGSTNLAFDQPGTFSMKYNMVWDKLWGTGIFTQDFRNEELKNNRTHFEEYGLPLDNRADNTKSDWYVWVAAMSDNKKDFESFIAPLWKAFDESPSRVPLTDWYDTISARQIEFQHRSVQGGLFMQLLMYTSAKSGK